MQEKKPPLWERDPARYAEKAKARIKKHSVEDPETGCWVWTAYLRPDTKRPEQVDRLRPTIGFRNRIMYAYRVAYVLWVGPIPEGLGIDHRCQNKLCVNPEHLEPVTHEENTRRYWARKRGEVA